VEELLIQRKKKIQNKEICNLDSQIRQKQETGCLTIANILFQTKYHKYQQQVYTSLLY